MEKKEKSKKIKKIMLKKIFLLNLLKSSHSFFRYTVVFEKFCCVSSLFLNQTVYIYNGSVFRRLTINKFIFCLKLGHFLHTRKPFKYLLKKKKR